MFTTIPAVHIPNTLQTHLLLFLWNIPFFSYSHKFKKKKKLLLSTSFCLKTDRESELSLSSLDTTSSRRSLFSCPSYDRSIFEFQRRSSTRRRRRKLSLNSALLFPRESSDPLLFKFTLISQTAWRSFTFFFSRKIRREWRHEELIIMTKECDRRRGTCSWNCHMASWRLNLVNFPLKIWAVPLAGVACRMDLVNREKGGIIWKECS